MKLSNVFKKTALAAVLAGSALVATASSADARVVCNRWGHCWHTYGYYHDGYYGDPYYPSYYSPGVTFGFNFGGGHHRGGGYHGGGGHHGGGHHH